MNNGFWKLVLVMAFVNARGISFPSSASYFAQFGLDASHNQIIRGAFPLTWLIFSLLIGNLVDVFGTRLCIVTSSLLAISATYFYLYLPGFYSFIIAESLVASAYCFAIGALQVLIGQNNENDQSKLSTVFASRWGILLFTETIVWSFSNMIGGYVAISYGLVVPYYLMMLSYFFMLVVAFILKEKIITKSNSIGITQDYERESFLSTLNRSYTISILLIFAIAGGLYRCMYALEPFYLKQAGCDSGIIGIITGTAYLGVGISALFAPRLNVRFTPIFQGKSYLIVTSFILLHMGAWISIFGGLLLFPLSLIRGAVRTNLPTSIQILNVPLLRGRVSGLFLMAEGIGGTITLVVSSLLISHFGLSNTILFGGVLGLFSLFLLCRNVTGK